MRADFGQTVQGAIQLKTGRPVPIAVKFSNATAVIGGTVQLGRGCWNHPWNLARPVGADGNQQCHKMSVDVTKLKLKRDARATEIIIKPCCFNVLLAFCVPDADIHLTPEFFLSCGATSSRATPAGGCPERLDIFKAQSAHFRRQSVASRRSTPRPVKLASMAANISMPSGVADNLPRSSKRFIGIPHAPRSFGR
jgi:hypothetical protein